ncbi:T9SS type A sorting domain-containing protein [Salinimicrobium terrae]|uniref:Ig-like domain-containing protein n=1 Tax=Salinimicrobium terrae TaxID=470866 RepID=UPI00048BD2DA|nr:T9SS type A sorting domain-containing protein [Salinimicrobium terrae]
MVKKLLLKVFTFWALILTSTLGWGQCPTSVSISASPGTTICAGTDVTFTASPNGGTNSSFQWQLNGTDAATGTTFSSTTLKNGDKVKVIISSITEGYSECSTTSNELTMTVNAVQTPTVSITTAKTSICPGESITFNASNTYGGTSPQYAWYINSNSTFAKKGASATFSSSDFIEGNNTVRVVLTSNFNCAEPTTAEATSASFQLKPDATIGTPTNKDQSICINKPLQDISFPIDGGATNATVTGLPPGISGSLSGGNYILSGSPTTKGTFPYMVTTTGTCAQKTATGTITVNPDATIALTSGNNSQTVCAAGGVTNGSISPITYSIGETGTGAAVTGLPPGITGSFNNGVFTIEGSSTETGTHNYSIKATGTCGDSAPLTGSITITENKVPSVSISSSDADNNICAGTLVTFTATPTHGGTNPIYQWKVDGSNAGTNNSTFTTTELTNGQIVTVEMSSSETCITTAKVTSNSITTVVNTNLTPEVTIEASDSDICPNDSVTFTATPVHGGANPSYQWKIGNTNVGTNSPTFTTTTLTDGQTVSVILSSNETCLASSTASSSTLTTTVQAPAPSPPGSITGPQEVCATANDLVYSVATVNDAESYTWSFPAGWSITNGQGTRTATFSAASTSGNISVAAVNTCGTSEATTLAVTPVDGVPATPGQISSSLPADNLNICPPLDNLKFWITDTGADSYNWILPSPGWEIVSGAGTNEITVRVTSATTNGSKEVKVEAVNICGNSTPSIFSGIVVDTHIIASVGEDQTVCKSVNSITINGTRSFGSANLTTEFFKSGTGTFSNLPGGNNKSGDFAINYTPSQADKDAGQVKITLTVPEPSGGNNTGNDCGNAIDEMFIHFKPDATISDPVNKTQVLCINSPLDPIVFTLGGTFSGATVTGLPAGVTGNLNNNTFTISGTPSVAGTFDYTVNTSGDCTQTSATGTLTVDPLTTVIAGEAETDVVCQSATPAAVTLTGAGFGGGATSAAWTITSGGGTLSSTDQTATPQNFTYTPAANYTGEVVLTLTTNAPGTCAAISATRTITVQPAPTILAGSATTDIVCQSDSPTPITLSGASIGGGATAAAWSIISGGGTLSSTALSENPQDVTYTPPAGYTGEVILSIISDAPGVCSAVNDQRTITIQPAATVDAGEAETDILCQSSNPNAITLTGAVFGGGATTAAWSINSGQGTLSSTDQTTTPQNVTFTPASDFTGEVVLVLTTNAPGTCAAVTDTRTITVEPAAIVEAGGIEEGEEGACQSATPGAITLSGAGLSGGAVTAAWSITEGGGSLSSTTQTSQPELVTYTPAPNFTGIVTLTLTSAPVGNCAAVSDTRKIKISEALTVEAGADIDLCSGSTTALSGISLGTGVTSARWEIISGLGELSSTAETANPETVTFTAPNQFNGQTILRLTSNNPEGLCEEIFDERIINIQQEVTITTPPVNLGICSTQNATFEVVASGDNLTYQWFFEGTAISNATDAKLIINQATSEDAGAYTVRITGEASCGEPLFSEPATLNIDEDIIIGTQPVGGNFCVGSTVNLSVEALAGGAELIYEWFNSNNESVGTGASIALENVQTSHSGSYYAIITGPAGFTCSTATSETVNININPAPVITAIGGAIEICSVGVEINITGGVEVSNHSSITWSVPEGMGTISNPTSLTNATYLPDGATGTVPLSLTVQGLDGCSEITATKNINIIPQPVITEFSYISTANTAVSGEFCETDSATYLPHTAGENLANGTGAFSVDNDALTVNPTTGAVTPNGTTPGEYIITYTYSVTSEPAGCSIASKTFKVIIGEKPIADFSYENTPFCSDAGNPTPVMAENAVIGTFSSTAGLIFIDVSTGEIDITGSTPGTYTVTNTIAAADGCAEVKATSTVTINQKPAAPGVTDLAYCLNATGAPTLTASADTGAILNWYNSAEGGTGSTTAPEPNVSTAGSTTYWVSQTSTAGCESDRAPITVTINPLPEVSITVDETIVISADGNPVICYGSSIELSGNGATSYSWSSNTENLDSGLTLMVSPTVTTTYNVTGTDGNGCSSTSEITVEVDPVTFTGSLEAPSHVCIDNPAGTLSLNSHIGEITKWEFMTEGQSTWSILNIGSVEPTQAFSGLTGTTVFRATIKSGVCDQATIEHTVTVDPLPEGGTVAFQDLIAEDNDGTFFMICEGATSGYLPLTLSESVGTIVAWKYRSGTGTWQTVGGIDNPFTGNILSGDQIKALNLSESTVFRVELASGACVPNAFSETAIISVIPTDIKPSPVTVSDNVVCLGDMVTLSSETGYNDGLPTVEGGAFDNAGLKNNGWRFGLDGNDANFETNANNTNQDFWSRATPHDFNTADYDGPSYTMTPQRWDAGVEDGNKGFALVSGDHTATMETNTFSIGSMDQAIVTFDQAYNLTPGATITVEISKDGGATYEEVLFTMSGSASSGSYSSFGTGTPKTRPKNKIVLDLGNYLGGNNLRIKFTFDGARDGDLWAVDAVELPKGPMNVTIEWNDYTDPNNVVPIGTTNSVQYAPKQIGLNVFEVKTKLVFDSAGNACDVAENSENIEVFVFDKYTTSVTAEYGSCGVFKAQLTGKIFNSTGTEISTTSEGEIFPTPDGYVGEWLLPETGVELIDPNPDDNIPAKNDPFASLVTTSTGTFGISWILKPTATNEAGEYYINPEACPPVVTPFEVVITGCIALDFDGQNDHIVIDDSYSDVVSFEAWIRPEVAAGTIISGPNFHITTPATVTPNTRWYHIAVSGGRLYLDGIDKGALSLGTGSGTKTVIGAELINDAADNFFHGWIEEVRLWTKELDTTQIRFLMNQRLIANEAQMGEQIPMNVPGGLTYSDLAGYYRLISAEPEPLAESPVVFLNEDKPNNGVTPDRAENKVPGRLVNMETNQQNTAPLPYYSANAGTWSTDDTWLRPDVWDPPHTGAIEWNIARTSHDINSGSRNIFLLGLISEANTLDMQGENPPNWTSGGTGNELYISHYLLLDGIIDLNGESQLVQPNGSIVDQSTGINPEVTGYLDRDQQGTASSYNYNYWSSPVSSGTGNAPYSVGAVMMDGTGSTPQPLSFGAAYHYADGGATTPRKVSAYWLHKFHGTANNYFKWEHIGSTGTLNTGEGYSMKGTIGPAAITESQNYTFRGLPNNGEILMVKMEVSGEGENYLIGNPYPSALNADEFILDNMKDVANGRNSSNIFNGTIYFWSHFANKTHYLQEYIGGYAAYNLSGGVKAVAIDERINATDDEGGREPRQFIPVGQGFFVSTQLDQEIANIYNFTIHGGQVTFKNSQREYITEVDASRAVFHSQERKDVVTENNNSSKELEQKRIWLKFKSPKGYHRQILVTANPNATDNFDLGYDAPLIENNIEDMYWYFNNYEFVIQGVSDFNIERELQLGIKVKEKGTLEISIDKLMNIAGDKDIFLKDSLLNVVHDLRKESYITESEEGIFTDRFKLVFQNEVGIEEPQDPEIIDEGHLEIIYVNGTRKVLVINPELIKVSRIYLNNILGQQVHVYYNIPLQTRVELPVNRFSSGVYILKLHTEQGIITKKVILE